MLRTLTPLVLLFAALPARAQQCGGSFVEGFTALSNLGAWGWPSVLQANMGTGGNPGNWLRSGTFTADLPELFTQDPNSPFAGDWRALDVTSAGVDLFAVDMSLNQCARPLTLRLSSDRGTPGVPGDDLTMHFVSAELAPCKDGEWHSFSVDVPSSMSGTLPPGWKVTANAGLPTTAVWDVLIVDVTQITWLFGDPVANNPSNKWILGADNPRLAYGGGPTTYCTAQVNSQACSPALIWQGTPSASAATPFFVNAVQVLDNVTGLFFYGQASAAIPTLGGTVCAAPPILRTPVQQSGGIGSGCSGILSIDFNAWAQSGVDPALVPGSPVHLQAWSRDPPAPQASSLSNALRFTLCP